MTFKTGSEIRANSARLRAALPEQTGIYYSLKANPHPAVLAALRACSALPEVCSVGELNSALQAGWRASEVLYTGPGKRDQDVTRALARIIHRTARNRPRPPNTWARDFIAKNFIKQPIRIVVSDSNGLALIAHFS